MSEWVGEWVSERERKRGKQERNINVHGQNKSFDVVMRKRIANQKKDESKEMIDGNQRYDYMAKKGRCNSR